MPKTCKPRGDPAAGPPARTGNNNKSISTAKTTPLLVKAWKLLPYIVFSTITKHCLTWVKPVYIILLKEIYHWK